jgi:enoyl-CoA hydratase
MELVLFEKTENIGILTFSNPSTLNSINFQVLEELETKLDIIENDKIVRCLIITGAGERAFIAGGDIALQNTFGVIEAYQWACTGHRCLRRLEMMPVPVIGAINGYALGGGTEVALACDLLIASENAIFAQPEVGLGIIPGFGGTQRLPRKVGLNKTKELIFTGMKITAQEAMRIGLVNQVVPQEDLMREAVKLAEMIVRNAPIAVRLAKVAMNDGIQCDLDRGLALERALFSECFSTEDKTIGMTAFEEKNKNIVFKNR